MKKIAMLCLLSLLFLCTGCEIVDHEANKQLVIQMVSENCDVLLADIAAKEFPYSEKIDGITSIHPEDDCTFIEYVCGGHGIAPSSSYWGFYYAEDDDMTKIWCANEPLVPQGEGFVYQQPDGDNRYYTEHIVDHFYFYEASY
ncbi:MAG: hypothetical protein IJO98_07795 [Clostridia bacterium]|nr:hypothetical protein [Clostridia bacterium]